MSAASGIRRQAGFTLLEVVLAMTLLAMVTGMIYAAFHLAVRAVEKGQAAVVSGQRARAANDVMRRQVKSMYAGVRCKADEDDKEGAPFFVVRRSPPSVEFFTAAGLTGGSGLEYVKYEVRGDPPQLVLTVAPKTLVWFGKEMLCGDLEVKGATEAVLLDGFNRIELEPQGYEKGARWDPDEGAGTLPRSVRVKIEGLAGSAVNGKTVEWYLPIIAQLSDVDDGAGAYDRIFGGVSMPTARAPGTTGNSPAEVGKPDAGEGSDNGSVDSDTADDGEFDEGDE